MKQLIVGMKKLRADQTERRGCPLADGGLKGGQPFDPGLAQGVAPNLRTSGKWQARRVSVQSRTASQSSPVLWLRTGQFADEMDGGSPQGHDGSSLNLVGIPRESRSPVLCGAADSPARAAILPSSDVPKGQREPLDHAQHGCRSTLIRFTATCIGSRELNRQSTDRARGFPSGTAPRSCLGERRGPERSADSHAASLSGGCR